MWFFYLSHRNRFHAIWFLWLFLSLSSDRVRAGELLPPGVAELYASRPVREASCDAVGSVIAAGTFDAMGLTANGIDLKFRSLVNTSRDAEEILSEVRNIIPNSGGRVRAGGVPWMMLNSPNPAAKRAAMHFQMQSAWNYLLERRIRSAGDPQLFPSLRFSRLLDLLEQEFTELGKEAAPGGRMKPVIPISAKTDYREQIATPGNLLGASALCLRAFPSYTETCSGSFLSSLVRLAPKFYANEYGQFYWLLGPLMNEVFRKPEYEKPILMAAALVMQRIRTAESTGKVEGDLMTDLFRMFAREAPGNPGLANERTWKTLAAYATQGASFAILENYVDSAAAPRLGALEIISAGMNYLDAFAEKEGQRFYSLPPFVTGSCRITKPYHFWLSAYAAFDAVAHRGRSAAAAAVESHMLGFIYELGARSNGRGDIGKVFRASGLHSVHNDSLRLSVLAKDLGALYGAKFKTYARGKRIVDVSAKYHALKNAARQSSCTEDTPSSDPTFGDVPLLGVFARLGVESKVIGCFEKSLAIHSLKNWSEFDF